MNKKDMFIREKLQQDKVISDRANKIFDNIKEEFKVENNEKKTIKISLGTFIAIAASLVIVGFVGISLYANSLGKPNIISGIQALVKDEPEVNVDEIAKELFEKGAYEIRKLEYSSLVNEEYEVADEFIEKEINGRLYVKTNEKYETVEQKYGEIFTGEALENVLSRRFANVNGILYISHGGATGWHIENVEVEKINEENGELTYRVSYNNSFYEGDISVEIYTCEFKIKEVYGEFRISATNYCNLDRINEEVKDNITNNNYLNNETAKTIIQSYLRIFGARQGSPVGTLAIEEIGLIDRNSEVPGGDFVDDENYRSSNINYEDFKNKMLEYMTEEMFEKLNNNAYKNINGKLYIFDGGATGIGFDIKEINLISSNQNSYRYSIRAIEYPPEEGRNCVGEVELQKNKDGKYVVSELRWTLVEEPENHESDSELTGVVSGADAMPAMLKSRNEEYKANYYYRLNSLRDNKDGTYTATVDFYSPAYIGEEGYNDMVNAGKIELNGSLYTFSNASNEFNEGYGYITSSGGQPYCVEKQERGYAFYREIGGVKRIIDVNTNSFEITLDKNTIVKVLFSENDYRLKDYASKLERNITNNSMITFEYSEDGGVIYIEVDPR